ncbi:MAG TPA: DUF5693 family protein [Trueperaceae bacterium]|nr:DUF5693 family protein [Trueperaceae bacterium]
MLNPPVRRLLWLLVALSLIPAGILVTRRIRAEGISERVALVMDAQALTDQAHELGMTPEALAERYRKLGLTGVAVYEDTIASLVAKGRAVAMLGGTARAQAAASGETPPNVPGDATLVSATAPGALDALLKDNVPKPTSVRFGGRDWYVYPGDVRNSLPAGPDMAEIRAWTKMGFEIAYRPRNAPYRLLDPGSDFPSQARYLIYAGTQVPGYPGNVSPLVKASQPYLTALIEGTPQQGLDGLLSKVPTVRLLSFNQDYINRRLSPPDLIDKYMLAVNERNIRLLYLRPYTTTDQGDMLANTDALVGGLSRALRQAGYTVAPLREQTFHYRTSAVLRALAGVGALAGVLLLAGIFPAPWGWIVAALLALLGVAAGGASWDALALLAALSFPVLGYGYLRRNVGSVVLATAVSVCGAALLAAVGSERSTMLAIHPFRGVGATLVVPPALFLLHYALRYRRPAAWVREFWGAEVRVSHVVLGLLAVAMIGFAFLRRGNTPIIGASHLELQIRQWLSQTLTVRPRFKELVGHPLAVLAFAFPRWPAWLRGLLLTGGVLAQASVLNTFSHYHTPLVISAERTGIALGIGLAVGLVLVPIARLVVRLGRAWLADSSAAGDA